MYRRIDSVTFNDLSSELLLLIFSDLDPASLIGVSRSCQRINAIALTFLLFLKTDFSDCLSRLRANILAIQRHPCCPSIVLDEAFSLVTSQKVH